MSYKKDCVYIVLVNVGTILRYEATNLSDSEDNNFIIFNDKNNREWNYNKNVIVSIVEKECEK